MQDDSGRSHSNRISHIEELPIERDSRGTLKEQAEERARRAALYRRHVEQYGRIEMVQGYTFAHALIRAKELIEKNEPIPEVMDNPDALKCVQCGRTRYHDADGLCSTCRGRHGRKKKVACCACNKVVSLEWSKFWTKTDEGLVCCRCANSEARKKKIETIIAISNASADEELEAEIAEEEECVALACNGQLLWSA